MEILVNKFFFVRQSPTRQVTIRQSQIRAAIIYSRPGGHAPGNYLARQRGARVRAMPVRFAAVDPRPPPRAPAMAASSLALHVHPWQLPPLG